MGALAGESRGVRWLREAIKGLTGRLGTRRSSRSQEQYHPKLEVITGRGNHTGIPALASAE